MAGSVNRVTLLGNLGRDPEVRSFANGGKVVNLRIATSETWKDKDGNRQEKTEWHSVAIFNEKLGEVAEKYLRKGSKVYIEGKLETRKWTDTAGQERYSTEVTLRNFGGELTLLDAKGDGQQDSPATKAPSGEYQQRTRTPGEHPMPPSGGPGRRKPLDIEDDIPFAPEFR